MVKFISGEVSSMKANVYLAGTSLIYATAHFTHDALQVNSYNEVQVEIYCAIPDFKLHIQNISLILDDKGMI